MKIYSPYFLTLALLTISINCKSQVITVIPALPTDADAVVVTFDATQSVALKNYTGTVYAHTGVKVEGSTAWAYVKGTWGSNTTQPALTRTGANTYTLSISPSIRQYYGVPADKKITNLCFVFRSSDATKQTSPDIIYTVYTQGLSVDITNPSQENPIVEYNSNLSIQVNSNSSTTLKLYIDNVEQYSTSSNSITLPYTANTYGKHWIKAIATNGTQTKKDSTYILVRPAVTVEDLPSGLKPGFNKIDNTTATLVLFDPPALKQYSYLIGNFSNWFADDLYYMKRTTDGKYYWITLTNLNPDKEYSYQFFVDGQIKLADPYCTKTCDPNDQYINQINYPDLTNYPKDSTIGIVSTFKINEETYTWNTTNFTPPQKKDLVIYELHIRDFISGDYIKTVQDSLDYLQKLGVNAIELMPISEFEGNDSWGYNPSFYFAADKAYGTKNDYKAFIDDCHSRGIAVIQDIVLNHSYSQSPLVQLYYNSSTSKVTSDNPWYNVNSPNASYSWGFDFNHESAYTKQFVDSILTYWLTEFKVDGFRFDFTKGFTNTAGDGGAYDASRIAILKHYADHIWDVNENAYLILEHFCANSEEFELSNYGMLIWGNMNYNYGEATMSWITSDPDNTDFSNISYKNRGWIYPHLVGYMESHDEERLMFKNMNYGNTAVSTYNVRDIPIGLARNEMAALFFFTVPGPKMIWQFGELGYDVSINYNNDRVGRKPIHWEYFNDSRRKHLLGVYSQLIDLKKNFPVFSTSNFSMSLAGAKKWIKLTGADMDVVVMGNFNVQLENYTLAFPNSGKWYEYFSQDSINLATTAYSKSFLPGEYRLYTSKKLKKTDIFLGINDPILVSELDVNLWPNPSDGEISIAFENRDNKDLTIALYSIIGQKVFEKNIEGLSFGHNSYNINFNDDVKPGIYLVRIQTGRQFTTKKLIIR